MFKKLVVESVLFDPLSQSSILILRTESGDTILPIWIGLNEATVISNELEKIVTPRPMTHDLICNLIKSIPGYNLIKVEIYDLRENTFYANLVLSNEEKEIRVDSRPSDAVAVALKSKVPIYVEEYVLKIAGERFNQHSVIDEILTKWLECLKPEDFGKYKM